MIQKEYFQILDTIFRDFTGVPYNKFANIGEFSTKINEFGCKISKSTDAKKCIETLSTGYKKLQEFYTKYDLTLFKASKDLSGVKLVLGGNSRFSSSHLNSIRKMLLYTDTILIPDPVLPWIENNRSEEKYRNILFLQAIFNLLHLKPLVDAELSCPPIVVFPSYEKSLETRDEITKQELNNLIVRVFGLFFYVKLGSPTHNSSYFSATSPTTISTKKNCLSDYYQFWKVDISCKQRKTNVLPTFPDRCL